MMNSFLESSVFFGLFLTLITYGIGVKLKQKLRLALFNPLLISTLTTIGVLLLFHVDYDLYYEGAKYISYLLTPATISLAIPLYEQLSILKDNLKAIMLGILSGVLTSLCSILAMSVIFGITHEEYVTLLPKSITTAIGMDVSSELGGYVSITVVVIMITGVFGNMTAEYITRMFKIVEPVARGVAIGSSAHAMGTVKAIEIGQIEGAISGLSIVVAGIMTVVGASIFAQFL